MKWLILLLLSTQSQAAWQCGDLLKVAVIDTGLDLNDKRFADRLCPYGHRSFAGPIKDFIGHGTHITGLIQKYAGEGNWCLLVYKYYGGFMFGPNNVNREIASIREAAKLNAHIVNISAGGEGFDVDEYMAIRHNPDTVFVTAAGNESKNMDILKNRFYPGSYKLTNITTVGNVVNGHRAPSSNWGENVKTTEEGERVLSTLPNGKMGLMSGTSQATAIHTGKLIKQMLDQCRYKNE